MGKSMSGTAGGAGGTGFKILFFKILKDRSANQKRGFIRILERPVEMPLVYLRIYQFLPMLSHLSWTFTKKHLSLFFGIEKYFLDETRRWLGNDLIICGNRTMETSIYFLAFTKTWIISRINAINAAWLLFGPDSKGDVSRNWNMFGEQFIVC